MLKWLLIASYLLKHAYDALIDHINDRHLEKPLPENVRDVYDEEEYAKWQSYHRENSRLGLIEDSVSLVITLALLVFNLLPAIFNSLSGMNIWLQYLSFMILTALITFPVETVFSYYDTFVIEEKYGMNKTTKRTFFLDTLKKFAIAVVLGYAVLAVVMFFFERYGNAAILLASAVIILLSLLMALLIMPLMRIFNKFTPLEEGELKDRLTSLCDKYGIEIKKIVVMDASRRTTRANAFCTGITKKKTISLDDNLVNGYSPEQITAVFAHEFAHARGKHTLKSIPFGIFRTILSVAVYGILLNFPVFFHAFGFSDINYLFVGMLSSMISWPVSELLDLVSNTISRNHEYEADAFAAKEGYGEDLISALKKLSKESLSSINPHPLVVALQYSHPTLSQRIDAIQNGVNQKK